MTTHTETRRESLSEFYKRLVVALELFPHCAACGADLTGQKITRLVFVPDRNRFKCSTCPVGAGGLVAPA